MADTKQATAETVCEHCGAAESAHSWVMQWCSSGVNDRRRFTPRTQSGQAELRIPDDLKLDWETLNAPYLKPVTLEWAIERDMSMRQFAKKLIERIARLEGGR